MSMKMIVKAGEAFDIELGSAPATGYAWELTALPAGLELAGSTFDPPAAERIGDPGVKRFSLQALQAGRFELHFVLKRRWEAEAIEQRVFDIEAR